MRIARLDLLRYGKFTDNSVTLPRSERDFHLIVGPNEAGKSTLRNAILDLLFGIETRSPFNFLHAYSDMRLGALLEHDGKKLDFVRVKARSKTLQGPDGTALPETALAAIIGTVDRGFFDQMFGLDHETLVRGGREILNASNDVGQILFQSAAGIGSLGNVKDALEAEANALWAKRRSGDREYYQASDELDLAEGSLKSAIVRTKDWVAARDLVEDRGNALDGARKEYHNLEQQRVRLDRLRRVAPLLLRLQSKEVALAALGEVVLLPPDAGAQVKRAELAIAKATQACEVFDDQAKQLEARLGEIHPDETVLARQADIEALAERRQQLRNHRADIEKRQEEVKTLWKAACGFARELGWPVEEEAALERRLPSKLIRSAAIELTRRYDLLTQSLATAQQAYSGKKSELLSIETELQGLPVTDIPPGLREVLAAARGLGDVAAQERGLAAQVTRTQRQLEGATFQLGRWPLDRDALLRLQLPSQEEVAVLQRRYTELETSNSSLGDQAAQLESEIQGLELEIAQYQAAHRPVSLAEVRQVRGQRDGLWQRIKSGSLQLAEAATDYESRVSDADHLSDQRHDKAQETSELQAKLDHKERLTQQLAGTKARQDACAQDRVALEEEWAARMAAIGLTGMALSQISDWRAAREHALLAANAAEEAQQSLDDLHKMASDARSSLAQELRQVGEETESLSFAALIIRAGEVLDGITRSQQRCEALLAQKGRAEVALAEHDNRVSQAQAALDAWRAEWAKHLSLAHLPLDCDTTIAETALTLISDIDDHLRQMRELRAARIDAMKRDLDDFALEADELVKAIAPELVDKPPEQVALPLAQRLAEAKDADRVKKQLGQELGQAHRQSSEAAARIQEAHAELAPLFHLANVATIDEVRVLIERSDQARSLGGEIREVLQAVEEAGDGLPRETLAAEFAACDIAQVPGELATLKAQVDDVMTRQNRISAELNSAQEALGRIAGQDQAAQAEARRQEALARMANAAERYIKVYTAAKLLRWAIDRYRETKQGPMLSRAGDIFSALTLGSFTRLVVDYENDPPTLYGQRASGDHVGIDGLSDGTRDQLYLALRLAALELHLQQAAAMPFIADDLFINYDDERSRAGLAALAKLSEKTQVIFLTHHDHLVPVVESVFGGNLNIIRIGQEEQVAES